MQQLIARAQMQTTDEVLAAIMLLGGADDLPKAERMTRAALIEVYGQREGQDAADTLMDALGM
jgi:hypothetical protein